MIDMKRAAMLGGDPADRKEASYWPTHEDSPEDIWADEGGTDQDAQNQRQGRASAGPT
jgi:hypothetical protein